MKKYYGILCLLVLSILSCSKYDDSEIWNYVKEINSRLTALEEKCKEMNTNISSLQTIVSAAENGDYITNVAPVTKDGETIGYTISFKKADPITIYNGKDGTNGYTPVIAVKKDTDGLYYWTIEGEWLLDDNGNKVQASATNGTTPQLKIENEYWYVSYDSGATWQMLGKATGDKGDDGQSFFSSVEVGTNEVTFVLADGTSFSIPLKNPTVENVHEWVDLGLPSGTLWATCNIGADIPWEYGDYFAWGETETKNWEGYDWVTYKYCNDAENKLTKYGFDRNYGIVDNIIALEPIDDAATVNWGSEWQTPSSEQVSELLSSDYTIIEWKNMQYGVNGIKITSKNNGNCIFLSAAGSGFRAEYRAAYRYQGESIYYWTRSLSTGSYRYGERAYIISYGSMGGALNNETRCTGLPIRPVRKQ